MAAVCDGMMVSVLSCLVARELTFGVVYSICKIVLSVLPFFSPRFAACLSFDGFSCSIKLATSCFGILALRHSSLAGPLTTYMLKRNGLGTGWEQPCLQEFCKIASSTGAVLHVPPCLSPCCIAHVRNMSFCGLKREWLCVPHLHAVAFSTP